MASQQPLNDDGAQNKSLLAADGETDSETRRIHSRTRGSVNATVVEVVDASGNQVTNFGGSAGLTDTQLRATPVPVSGTVTVDTSALATAAKQDTGNTSLGNLDTKTGEVQASPTANTILGRLKSLEDKLDALQTELNQKYEGGTITANLGTIADVATQTTLALIKAKTDNLDIAISALRDAITKTGATSKTLADVVAALASVAVTGTFWQATQPVSEADGQNVTLGAKADAKNSATDTTAITAMQVLKQISYMLQNPAALAAGTAAIGKLLPPDIDVTTHTNYARKYYTNAGAVTDGIIWSPASGKRWHVVTMYIQVSAAATVTLEDDKAGGDDPVWKGEIAANSGVILPFTEKYPMASGEDAADLLITTSAGNVYVTCVGYEI